MFVTICWKVTIINKPPVSRDRLVVRTLRCGRSNPGSNPGHGMQKQFFPHPVSNVFGAKRWGLNRDLNPGPLAPKARIIPLDHWASFTSGYQTGCHYCEQSQGLLAAWDKLAACISNASIAQWQSVGLVNQRSWVQSSLEANSFWSSLKWHQKFCDPDVIRTRSLLIWSQTRYRCATESTGLRFHRDLNSDRWIQSPEC